MKLWVQRFGNPCVCVSVLHTFTHTNSSQLRGATDSKCKVDWINHYGAQLDRQADGHTYRVSVIIRQIKGISFSSLSSNSIHAAT